MTYPYWHNTELLDDFETLMSLENDYDNTHLMPIGGTPAMDVTKEMNTGYGGESRFGDCNG